jgi:hypothetical protein
MTKEKPKLIREKPIYIAPGNNCAVFVGDVLSAGKVPVAVHVVQFPFHAA